MARSNSPVQPRGATLGQRLAPSRGISIALVLLCCGLGSTPVLGWNPYDTDSAQGRDDVRPWTNRESPDPPSYPARGDNRGAEPAAAPGFAAPVQAAPGFNDPWAVRVRPRYRFRGDATEDGASGSNGAPAGLRYRTLTDRERQRHAPAADQPGYRPRDLQPQGPSWRLEDEGSAFGYHPDYQRFDAIPPPLPR